MISIWRWCDVSCPAVVGADAGGTFDEGARNGKESCIDFARVVDG